MKGSKKCIAICGGLISAFLLIRAGEYLVDYSVGDQDGKITTPLLSSGLSVIYRVIIISLILLLIFRLIKFMFPKHALVAERSPVFPDRTLRIVLFILSIIVYFIQSYAFPMSSGRSHFGYLIYYFDFFSEEPVYHIRMICTPPLSAFIISFSLQYGGSLLLELIMSLCYAGSIVAMYNLGLLWNRKVALSAAVIVLLYPAYALFYHQPYSDGLFAFGFFLWCHYIVKTYDSPSVKKFVISGLIVFVLNLIRPQAPALLLSVIIPFLIPKLPMRKRLLFSVAFLATCVFFLTLWSFHNSIRYGGATVSHGSAGQSADLSVIQQLSRKYGHIVFEKLFVSYKLIKPENGKYSLELHETIKRELLPKEPYKSYGITIEKFYSSPNNTRMWSDLESLSLRVWGWNTGHLKLGAVAIEAIKNYPLIFIKNLIRDWYHIFTVHQRLRVPKKKGDSFDIELVQQLNEKSLPVPTRGQEIPRAYWDWQFTSPDNRMLPDPNSIELKFPIEQQRKIDALHNKIRNSVPQLPVRDGNETLAHFFNTLLSFFPKMLYWVLLSVIGFVFFADTRRRLFMSFFFMALMIICVAYMATISTTVEYRAPFDPIFIIGGTVAFMKLLEHGMKLVE